ncbi:MAG: nucleotidyltransferase domain-containing protein [Candidatus Aenigmatarchaeota archaeon]
MKGIDIALEIAERKRKLFKNYKEIARKIKESAKKVLKDDEARVIIFGSVIKGKQTPLSDLDILIITEKANKIDYGKTVTEIKERVKKDLIGVEFHIVTKEVFENWYKRFLDKYEEV